MYPRGHDGIAAGGLDTSAAPSATDDPAPAEGEPSTPADSYDVLEAVPLAVLVVDRRRDILWANDRTRLLLGEVVAGRSLMGVLRHPPLIDALDQVVGGALAGGPMGIEGVETPIGRDRLLIADLKGLEGERVLIALKDASAERRLERLRADFVANVSHELKTPLASLIGFIETLRGPAAGDPEARQRFLEIMQEQAARMRRLVDDHHVALAHRARGAPGARRPRGALPISRTSWRRCRVRR